VSEATDLLDALTHLYPPQYKPAEERVQQVFKPSVQEGPIEMPHSDDPLLSALEAATPGSVTRNQLNTVVGSMSASNEQFGLAS
jgi:hypothetical protein